YWFKFSKYEKHQYFAPHRDGAFIPKKNKSNIFSIVIFLNDDFAGGQTRFVSRMLSSEEDSVRLKDVLATVHPCTGSAVIFNHDMIHEGLPVLEGKKYIVRTEIMFKGTNKLLSPLNNPYLKDEKYLEYENIDPKKCTETYIKAQ